MTAPDPTAARLADAPHVLIVHGFGATAEDHWFPWLARALPRAERLTLPSPRAPVAAEWIQRTADALERFGEGTAVVAHSLGNLTALQALRRLEDRGTAMRLSAFVGVAPFAAAVPPVGEPELDAFLAGAPGRPAGLQEFLVGVDLPRVKPLLGSVRVLRADEDPIVPASLSDEVAAALQVSPEIVPGAGHFLAEDGVRVLPTLLDGPRDPA